MKQIIGIIAVFFSLQLMAQTDIIEYRSHSGNMAKFTKHSTLAIDGVLTNFGMMPTPMVKNAALDTVRFISDSTAIMVTSEYCSDRYIVQPIFDTEGCLVTRAHLGQLWSAGSDTVLNHPLFVNQHSLDSIKDILSNTYNFKNSMDSVVFIGYDNGNIQIEEGRKSEEDVNQLEQEVPKKNNFGPILLFTILVPILLLYIFSPSAYKWAKK